MLSTKIFPVHCLCSSPLSPIHREKSTMLGHSTGRLQGSTAAYTQLPEGPGSPMTRERQTACGKRQQGATFSMPLSGIQVTTCFSSYLLIDLFHLLPIFSKNKLYLFSPFPISHCFKIHRSETLVLPLP